MYDRVTVKETAKERLSLCRGSSIGALVLYDVLLAAIAGVTFGFGTLFLAPPLMVGLSLFFLAAWRDGRPAFEMLFRPFNWYGQTLVGILWMGLWTFLWSLLFVIPGIVKALAYSMTPYLLADYPDLGGRQALKVSMAITQGRKAEIFVMYLSFLGWTLLSGLTFGILYFVHVGPYMQIAYAGMYERLLADAYESGAVTDADLGM